jgi:hypothetical protein
MDHCNSYGASNQFSVISLTLNDLELEDPVKSPFSFLKP